MSFYLRSSVTLLVDPPVDSLRSCENCLLFLDSSLSTQKEKYIFKGDDRRTIGLVNQSDDGGSGGGAADAQAAAVCVRTCPFYFVILFFFFLLFLPLFLSFFRGKKRGFTLRLSHFPCRNFFSGVIYMKRLSACGRIRHEYVNPLLGKSYLSSIHPSLLDSPRTLRRRAGLYTTQYIEMGEPHMIILFTLDCEFLTRRHQRE